MSVPAFLVTWTETFGPVPYGECSRNESKYLGSLIAVKSMPEAFTEPFLEKGPAVEISPDVLFFLAEPSLAPVEFR